MGDFHRFCCIIICFDSRKSLILFLLLVGVARRAQLALSSIRAGQGQSQSRRSDVRTSDTFDLSLAVVIGSEVLLWLMLGEGVERTLQQARTFFLLRKEWQDMGILGLC